MVRVLEEKLTEAINAKNNDVNSFIWKFPINSDGSQDEIRLMDATPEQLNTFYNHCNSMLYNNNKINPGRYVLLDIIKEQRQKCNIELFLRKLETGSLCADGKSYPRYLYRQDLRAIMDNNKEQFPPSELKNISIATCTNGLPREFERISIDEVMSGCLDTLGFLDCHHITRNFILKMGVFLTPAEYRELTANNKETKKVPDLIKERLGMRPNTSITICPSGLNLTELRAMLNLRSKKYSELTTDQLITLRNKVLFRLEEEIGVHIQQWEERQRQIKLVADARNIILNSKTE